AAAAAAASSWRRGRRFLAARGRRFLAARRRRRRYLARPDPSCGGGRQRWARIRHRISRVVAADVVAAGEAGRRDPTGSRGEEEALAWWRDY
ncbi:hypothetical protein EE612_018656, partial [Oryza sativa]